MSKPYHLFISYAAEDEQFASELARALKFLGISSWFAPLSLNVGDRLLDSINAGLMASEYGLLVLSPAYIAKHWTAYELDVLHRQHIEADKDLLPIWHNVGKAELDKWNPGLTGIYALRSADGVSSIASKIANRVYQNCSARGVNPSYENPQWRFLQGCGELLINNENGPAFNLFEAAEFPDTHFPLYVHNRPYSRQEIVLAVAKALHYGNPDVVQLLDDHKERMKQLCKKYGYDLDAPGFDPAIYG